MHIFLKLKIWQNISCVQHDTDCKQESDGYDNSKYFIRASECHRSVSSICSTVAERTR